MNEPAPGTDRHLSLAEAQALLEQRRAALRLDRAEAALNAGLGDPGKQLTVKAQHSTFNGQQSARTCEAATQDPAPIDDNLPPATCHTSARSVQASAGSVQILPTGLPDHLGWGSEPLTQALRAAARRQEEQRRRQEAEDGTWLLGLRPAAGVRQPAAPSLPSIETTLPLPPTLGLAILKSKRAAHGRLWLLLRLLDQQGRGWVDLQEARDAFCSTASPLRFCSRRHLRGLLAGGEHLFWSLGRGRVWMRSTARLAKALDVEHFGGRDVSLPVRVLVGGIAQVRAHLYAAFHSGRSGKPIARRTIQSKSGVAPRTQRLYDHHAGLEKRANYALGPQIGSEAAERIAVVQGPAAFVRRGKRGHNGEARRFLAWQLPNSYHGPHAPLGRGRQKRHNGTLVGLLNKGTAGNGQRFRDELPRRFFAQARAAAAAYGRSTETVYWPAPQKGHWHCLWPSGPEMGGGTMQ